jgi:hypothetical protein
MYGGALIVTSEFVSIDCDESERLAISVGVS